MLKSILITFFALTFFIPTAHAAMLAPGTPTADLGLDITSREQCDALGGLFEECPPNDCQQSPDYQAGNVVCTTVCGTPRCFGIVPAETGDLSAIQNPGAATPTAVASDTAATPTSVIPSPTDELPPTTLPTPISNRSLAVYVIAGLVLIGLFLILKYRGQLFKSAK